VTQLLGLLDNFASVLLSGGVGVGKTAIALSLLHHDQIEDRFGENRHFMRCDGLTNSLPSFLERLSDLIGLPPIGTMEQLRPHLPHLHPLLLVLDGVECILDPLAAESDEITSTIEEIARHQTVCILATSRMAITIPVSKPPKCQLSLEMKRKMYSTACAPSTDLLLSMISL